MRLISWGLAVALSLLAITLLPGTVSAAGHAASTPRQAVTIFVEPLSVNGKTLRRDCHPGERGTLAATIKTCPMTPRFEAALLRVSPRGNPICRCGNPPGSITIFPASMDSSGTTVEGFWYYSSNSFVITYVLVHRPSGWLIDNMYCLRHPETSIYTSRAEAPCP